MAVQYHPSCHKSFNIYYIIKCGVINNNYEHNEKQMLLCKSVQI